MAKRFITKTISILIAAAMLPVYLFFRDKNPKAETI